MQGLGSGRRVQGLRTYDFGIIIDKYTTMVSGRKIKLGSVHNSGDHVGFDNVFVSADSQDPQAINPIPEIRIGWISLGEFSRLFPL